MIVVVGQYCGCSSTVFSLSCIQGVRLNKPYAVRVPMDIPVFTGTHADFLIIVSLVCEREREGGRGRREGGRELGLVWWESSLASSLQHPSPRLYDKLIHYYLHFIMQVFHKIITTGHQRLQPLFDCLLTIIVNGEWETIVHVFPLWIFIREVC